MKKIISILILLFVLRLLNIFPVYAFEAASLKSFPASESSIFYELPFPGILPDHPLYPLKTLRDKILSFFTRKPVGKYHLYLLFADKHLAMGQMLIDKGSFELAAVTFINGENYLFRASIQALKLRDLGMLQEGVKDKLETACDKHAQIISRLLESKNTYDKQKLNEAYSINHQAKQLIKP